MMMVAREREREGRAAQKQNRNVSVKTTVHPLLDDGSVHVSKRHPLNVPRYMRFNAECGDLGAYLTSVHYFGKV